MYLPQKEIYHKLYFPPEFPQFPFHQIDLNVSPSLNNNWITLNFIISFCLFYFFEVMYLKKNSFAFWMIVFSNFPKFSIHIRRNIFYFLCFYLNINFFPNIIRLIAEFEGKRVSRGKQWKCEFSLFYNSIFPDWFSISPRLD